MNDDTQRLIEEMKRRIESLERRNTELEGQVAAINRKIDGASLYLACDGSTLTGSLTWGG